MEVAIEQWGALTDLMSPGLILRKADLTIKICQRQVCFDSTDIPQPIQPLPE